MLLLMSDYRDEYREKQAEVIRANGYCIGCGSKIKKNPKVLAYRHALACSMAHMNREGNQ